MFLLELQEGRLREQKIVVLQPIPYILHEMIDITEDIDLMVIDSEGIHYITAPRQ